MDEVREGDAAGKQHEEVVNSLLDLQAQIRERKITEEPAAPAAEEWDDEDSDEDFEQAHLGMDQERSGLDQVDEDAWATLTRLFGGEPDQLSVVHDDVTITELPDLPDPLESLEHDLAVMADSVDALRAELDDRMAGVRQDLWSEVQDLRNRQSALEFSLTEALAAHRDQLAGLLDEHFASIRRLAQGGWDLSDD